MQTYLIEKTKNTVKLGFKDTNLTLLTPLIKVLEENDDVVIVRYIDSHPELKDRVLYVETKKGDPMKTIEAAAEQISKFYVMN